jgi:hypothetical protein
MLELAVEKGADKRLKKVINHCKPYRKKELLFYVSVQCPLSIPFTKILTRNLPLWRKWGLYSNNDDFPRIWRNRKYVLMNNPELARRDKEKKRRNKRRAKRKTTI